MVLVALVARSFTVNRCVFLISCVFLSTEWTTGIPFRYDVEMSIAKSFNVSTSYLAATFSIALFQPEIQVCGLLYTLSCTMCRIYHFMVFQNTCNSYYRLHASGIWIWLFAELFLHTPWTARTPFQIIHSSNRLFCNYGDRNVHVNLYGIGFEAPVAYKFYNRFVALYYSCCFYRNGVFPCS